MTHEGFEKLYKLLFPKANHTTTEGGHDGHGHKRKRRSIDASTKVFSISIYFEKSIIKIHVATKYLLIDEFQPSLPSFD